MHLPTTVGPPGVGLWHSGTDRSDEDGLGRWIASPVASDSRTVRAIITARFGKGARIGASLPVRVVRVAAVARSQVLVPFR